MTPTCRACQAALPPASKFCNACGVKVTDAPDDAREPRSYTPKHLVERILGSRAAVEGERKQVTVLFADVKGSMELAEQIDAEDWHRVLDGFFRILADGVHRFEGTVNQYTGDGIMALFGAPLAHEDHAHRACYAALYLDAALRTYADEIRRSRGLSFAVRMGLNSGEVVVGAIGDDLRMDYTAQGPVVGLAARMEQLAEPGRVYLTRQTADLVAGFFRLRDLGTFTIRGVSEPVPVFELRDIGALRARLDVARARGFTRFVGRLPEMATLDAALDRAVRGAGCAVGVSGEAGLGKSRLCFELTERCRARGIPVLRAQAVAHGKAVPFLPVLDLLRAYFGLAEHDAPPAARDKIAGRIVLLDASLAEAVPLLFDFLGVADSLHTVPEMEPEARQRRLLEVVGRLVRAQHAPQVFLLEDLHWLDGASQAFVESLVAALPTSHTLLLANYRPVYRPGWRAQQGCAEIALTPLGDEAVDALLTDLLGGDASVARLVELVRAHTAGNPFFMEEIVHELAETGVLAGGQGRYRATQPIIQLALPATVQAVIAARIDRVPDAAKTVLQTAAVIGKDFATTLLADLVALPASELTQALQTLVHGELIVESALYPEALYSFKHPLTQEVAYRSQLGSRRRHTHAAVARAIVAADAGRLDERAALVAHHWEEAGEWFEATRWSRRAAQWARSHDLAETMAHWRTVRRLLARAGDAAAPASEDTADAAPQAIEACTAILGLGWLVGIPPDEAAAVFADGSALAARVQDARWQARLLTQYAGVKSSYGEVDEYLRLSQEAVRTAAMTDDVPLRATVQIPLVRSHLVAGRLREALALAETALMSIPADPEFGNFLGYSPYLNIWLLRANLLGYAGRWPDAVDAFKHTMRVCREHRHPVMLAHASSDFAWWSALLGDAHGALAHAREGLEIADKMGSRMTRLFACNALAFAELQIGRPADAVAVLEEARALASTLRTETQVDTLTLLARAYLASGDSERARAMAEAAVGQTRKWNARAWECLAQLAYAFVLVRSVGVAAAAPIETALARALELIEDTGARAFEPFVRRERAALARLRGDIAGADQEEREVQRLLLAMGVSGAVAPAGGHTG